MRSLELTLGRMEREKEEADDVKAGLLLEIGEADSTKSSRDAAVLALREELDASRVALEESRSYANSLSESHESALVVALEKSKADATRAVELARKAASEENEVRTRVLSESHQSALVAALEESRAEAAEAVVAATKAASDVYNAGLAKLEAQKNVESLRDELADVTGDYEVARDLAGRRKEELDAIVAELSDVKSRISTMVGRSDGTILSITDQLDKIAAEKREVTEKVEQLEELLVQANNRVASLSSAREGEQRMETVVSKFQMQLKEADDACEKLRAEIKRAVESENNVREELLVSHHHARNLAMNLEESSRRIVELEKLCDETKQENEVSSCIMML